MSKEEIIIKIMKEDPTILLWQEKHLIARFNSNTNEIRRCITKARKYKKGILTNEIIINANKEQDIEENQELQEIYENEYSSP